MRQVIVVIAVLVLASASCARLPTSAEANAALLSLKEYGSRATEARPYLILGPKAADLGLFFTAGR
jgi:hypothetical protein